MTKTATPSVACLDAAAAIDRALRVANGGRRTRTVSFSDAVDCVRAAIADGSAHVNGGTVANSYGYAAVQTRVAAYTHNGIVYVHVRKANASKAGGTALPWPRNAKPERVAAAAMEDGKRPDGEACRMSVETAAELVSDDEKGTATVCGRVVYHDRSGGQGHNWVAVDASDIPANVVLEIEGEMIDGKGSDASDYVASNGQHYRW